MAFRPARITIVTLVTVQPVGSVHFVDRTALVAFLNRMAAVEGAIRARLAKTEPAPKPRPLRNCLPAHLCAATLSELQETSGLPRAASRSSPDRRPPGSGVQVLLAPKYLA